MREAGEVRKIVNGQAHVLIRVPVQGCCGACLSCGLSAGTTHEVVVKTIPGLQARDQVVLEIPTVSTWRASALLFLIPLVLLIGVTALGHRLLGGAAEGSVNGWAVGMGVAAMALWYLGVALLDRRSRTGAAKEPRIVERTSEQQQA